MASHKSILNRLFDDAVDIRLRLLRVILNCVCVAAFICGIPMIITQADGWWLNIILCAVAVISQIINLKFGKTDAAALVLAISTDCFLIPVMYFTQGGFQSGMPVWMLFCTLVTFMMMIGWKRYVIPGISIAIDVACFLTEYFRPELVIAIPDRWFVFSDFIISFAFATVIFDIILDIHLRAYKLKSDQLSYSLRYDALTGVENRYGFENYIRKLDKAPLSEDLILVAADVNGLKVVNDSLGHAAGDELLIGAARVFFKTFARYGNVYRTGGDEFQAVLMTDKQVSEIQAEFEENMKNWKGETVKELHISAGYACNRDVNAETCAELVKKADRNMYYAKAEYYRVSGINRRKR